jgi:hypothetical protein
MADGAAATTDGHAGTDGLLFVVVSIGDAMVYVYVPWCCCSGIRFFVHSQTEYLPPPLGKELELPELPNVTFDLAENFERAWVGLGLVGVCLPHY